MKIVFYKIVKLVDVGTFSWSFLSNFTSLNFSENFHEVHPDREDKDGKCIRDSNSKLTFSKFSGYM